MGARLGATPRGPWRTPPMAAPPHRSSRSNPLHSWFSNPRPWVRATHDRNLEIHSVS